MTMDRIRIYRIISFAIIFFSLIVIGTNLFPFMFSTKDNLISLFYVRKDNITGELQGEIYPIALYTNGQYINASVDVTGEDAAQVRQKNSYLENIRSFTIIEDGKKLGHFSVDAIDRAGYMCSEILIGKSKSKPDGNLLNIFKSINDSKTSCSIGYQDHKEFNYSLKWTLAASNSFKHKTKGREPVGTDIERYRRDLLNIGTNILAGYRGEVEEKEVFIEKIAIFDLDHDGTPEVTAKLRKPLVNKSKIYREGKEVAEENSNDNVYLNLWVSYNGNSPNVIASLIAEEDEGSWGTGYDLVGTIDANGDGIDEVIIRSSSWEVVDFEIYEYRQNKLDKVFRGAGFGC